MVFKKEQPTSDVVVGKKEKLSTRLQRKAQNTTKKQRIGLLVALGVIFVLVLVLVYAYGDYKGNEEDNRNAVVSVCGKDEKLIWDFTNAVNEGNTEKITIVTDGIVNLSNHEKDVSCLYMATRGYIEKSDIQNAEKYYGLLEKKVNGGDKYAGVLEISAEPLETISKRLEVKKQLQSVSNDNFKGIGEEIKENN